MYLPFLSPVMQLIVDRHPCARVCPCDNYAAGTERVARHPSNFNYDFVCDDAITNGTKASALSLFLFLSSLSLIAFDRGERLCIGRRRRVSQGDLSPFYRRRSAKHVKHNKLHGHFPRANTIILPDG